MAFWKRNDPTTPPHSRKDLEGNPPTLEDLGLAHLTFDQRVGLRDDVLAGWYLNGTGELVAGFPITDADVLVDVGCGSGGPLEFCARHAGKVYAIDVDQNVIDHARDRMINRGVDVSNVTFTIGTGDSLPLDDTTATRVICLEVLEHVFDPTTVLSEIVRITSPGALILISVPDGRGEEFLHHYAPPAEWEPPHHIRTFTTDQLAEVVRNSGLEIVSSGTSGFFRAIWLALYWSGNQNVRQVSHEAISSSSTESNTVLHEWVDTWNSILDRPLGTQLKQALDGLLPKSQYVVARKP